MRSLHIDLHLTLGGELDGIADQVDHDLAQAAWIADEHIWHLGLYAVGELQSLFVRP